MVARSSGKIGARRYSACRPSM